METRKKLEKHLSFLYGKEASGEVAGRIEALIERYADRVALARAGWDERDVWLITYGDSIREAEQPPLRTLRRFLEEHVGDAISFLHVLPFFPWSSDDGFSVIDYRAVDPALGDWSHIGELKKSYRLVFDAVFNHVSASSLYMEGFRAGKARFADFFIELSAAERASGELDEVVRPRSTPLCHRYETAEGPKWLWTTFGPDQIDLSFRNPDVLVEMVDVWLFYLSRGASALRLDAIAYLWKELGTSCIHHPKTHEVVKLLRTITDRAVGKQKSALLLTETNVPHEENVSYFGEGTDEAHIVYNFPLAPLVLHASSRGDASKLTAWARGLERPGPANVYLNFTASHDGIGVRPTEGILSAGERAALAALARAHGGEVSHKRDADGELSPYELNITYFDALNDPRANEPLDVQVARFVVSQAIPLALAGIPAVYIHSLLATRNDHQGVAESGRPRSINRAKLEHDRLVAELADPHSLRARVFSAYRHMLRARRAERAFHPDAPQEILELDPRVFALRRSDVEGEEAVLALHNVSAEPVRVRPGAGFEVRLASHETRWLKESRDGEVEEIFKWNARGPSCA